jgi:hypothetical protein
VTLPNPRAVDGAVVLDVATRTATVMPAETGFPAMLWRRGIEKMMRGGYGAPTVWAHGLGHPQIAPGQPEGGALKFTFHKGDPAWAELLGTPRLSAIITVDREAGQILGVKFRGRKSG